DLDDERHTPESEDRGSAETFFAWFFRGEGPGDFLSGAAFHKNRLVNARSAYVTFFEDNHVAALLGRSENVLEALASALGQSVGDLTRRLRDRAFGLLQTRRGPTDGYPRLYTFQSY